MIKTSLRKQLLFLISSVFAGIGVILACAGGWWSFDETTNYTTELFVDRAYSPFFYSFDYYNEIGHDDKQNDRFNATVANDWYSYLDKKFPQPEIEYLLFKTYPKTIDSILKPGLMPYRFANYLIIKNKDKKATDFLNYLNLAKQSETFALRTADEWYYNDKPVVRSSSSAFCNSILSAYKASKDNFIKQRYLFQLVRAFYFNKDYNNCTIVFETNASAFPKNTMYYRTLSYAAGAYKKLGKISEANYYYSLVYNNCDELKTTAHFSFKPQEEKDWQQTLTLCKTDDEKCTLWQMIGVFYKDEVRSISEIAKLNPKSDKLDLLLSRAINKIESQLFETGINNEFQDDNGKKVANSSSSELKKIISEIISGNKNNKPYQWHLALGYLQMFDREHNKAFENYNLAKKSAGSNKAILNQIRLFELINTIYDLKFIDSKVEDKLVTELNWLDESRKSNVQKELRLVAVNSWIKKVMAKKYRFQKDLLKAEYYEVDHAFYANEKQLHDMQNQLLKINKTSYEKYCESIYQFNINTLYEYEAIGKTYKDDIDAAIALMEKAGKNGETVLLSNPFNGGIKDCHDCDHALLQKTKYTKLSTLKKMKDMKDKLPTDTYNNALLIGNAYYNFTFYGSSRVFYYCPIVDEGSSMSGMISKDQVGNLLNMTLAKKYYTMALTSATTDEQKAKCTYLLSKCERNEWYNSGGSDNGTDFIAFKNFIGLKKYTNTKYYKEVIAECGYFKKYAVK